MTASLQKYLPYAVLFVIVAMLFVLGWLSGALPNSVLDGLTPFLLFLVVYIVLVVISEVCVPLSAYFAETLHASRVARLTDTVGRVAGDIADSLQQHPAYGTNQAVLDVVKAGLVAEGAKYVQASMPDTVAAVGITPATLGAMISKEASGKLLAAAAAPALAGIVANAASSAVAGALATAIPSIGSVIATPATAAAAA